MKHEIPSTHDIYELVDSFWGKPCSKLRSRLIFAAKLFYITWNIFSDCTTVKNMHQLLFKNFKTVDNWLTWIIVRKKSLAAVTSLGLLSGQGVIDTRLNNFPTSSTTMENAMKTRFRNLIIDVPCVPALLCSQYLPHTFPSVTQQTFPM